MFCPSCGVEDIKSSQFCRACGAELLVVRAALEQRADTGPIEADNAREQIGRALADKIKQFETAADLKLAIYEILHMDGRVGPANYLPVLPHPFSLIEHSSPTSLGFPA